MPDSPHSPGPAAPGPFDVQTVHYLVRLMRKNDLTQIDLRDGEQRIILRRGSQGMPNWTMTPMPAPAAVPVPAAAPAPTAAPAEVPKPAADRKLHEIKSPTPGTFYISPSPDAKAFVQPGSKVKADTVVCIIEAMKVFNEIPAECVGTIVEVCVQNQQSVEYGQVLFKVDPSA